MLKGIPAIISPELLKVLDEMGHGDTILLADGNYPSESMGKNSIVIRGDGHGACEYLEAILKLFPLDTYVEKPVTIMKKVPGDTVETPIWDEFKKIVSKEDSRGESVFSEVERFEFYERSKKAYAIIATGELALYGNVMLQKGVVVE